MSEQPKQITVDEEMLWTTLHPFGVATFMESLARFLGEYDDDSAHRYGVGFLNGKLSVAALLLREIGEELDSYDWQEFKRRKSLEMVELQKERTEND